MKTKSSESNIYMTKKNNQIVRMERDVESGQRMAQEMWMMMMMMVPTR